MLTGELEQDSQCSGNEMHYKHKSKRGGDIEVSVKNKVTWPHELILGGAQRHRVLYDQLSLTQGVQGFCKNILEERSHERREAMVAYMSNLMEGATDFLWQCAKAAHAVMLCKMERGVLSWEDSDPIDRIRRAHEQKHIVSNKSGWSRMSEASRKLLFCKGYLLGNYTHSKDHESNGKLQKHVCVFSLRQTTGAS